ncbi:MAG: hypothetical protein Q4G40_04750, partial [Brachybacterium sp.]|nr:hypothetical protein [Brachybacterium sp.]
MTDTGRALLGALTARGPQPALIWYGPEGRTELSGAVLANWLIKSVNHLADEVMLDAGDAVTLQMPAHWKRFVLATAARMLGAEVT